MSDLTERLRALAREYYQHRPHYEAAAAEIERLTKERDEFAMEVLRLRGPVHEETQELRARSWSAELTRLRAENARLKEIEIKYGQFYLGSPPGHKP